MRLQVENRLDKYATYQLKKSHLNDYPTENLYQNIFASHFEQLAIISLFRIYLKDTIIIGDNSPPPPSTALLSVKHLIPSTHMNATVDHAL